MMKYHNFQNRSLLMVTTLTTLGLLAVTSMNSSAIAGKNPDREGYCYFFKGDRLDMNEACQISTGYGAGAMYSILNWSDGIKTKIFNLTVCKEGGNCGNTVDDTKAEYYSRDLFLNLTEEEGEQEISCYRITSSNNSVCYRFKN